jgi:multidrug efflux pump subunit AcrA (membrane-fusion protein)
MYRRRRPAREQIAFGFDSFLDLVANVIGIIIRLILVAWVGGRSYHALLQWTQAAPEPEATVLPAPRREDDPLAEQLAQTQRELDAARARLLQQMRELGLAQTKRQELQVQRASLQQTRGALTDELRKVEQADGRHEQSAKLASLSLDELRRRQEELRASIKQLEAEPPPVSKVLRFRTPVSRRVHADEVFFECRAGRVEFIDLPAFLQEVQAGLDQKAEPLRTNYQLTERTAAVGAFRLRYVVERERDALEDAAPSAKPRSMFNFRYGVAEWEVEPIREPRGEALAEALAPGSAFRRKIDSLDGSTVITLWVYPDSFELFRGLRDFAHAHGLEVAGRPLPLGAPIAGSRHGSASRGQ